jgi:hypothetical protein
VLLSRNVPGSAEPGSSNEPLGSVGLPLENPMRAEVPPEAALAAAGAAGLPLDAVVVEVDVEVAGALVGAVDQQ